MSMSFGGFFNYGLVLSRDEFLDLEKYLKNDSVDFCDDEVCYEVGFNMWYTSYCDFVSKNEKYYKTFEDENIFIIELKKDNLYECYKNDDEIIEELENSLNEHFNISMIKKELGEDFIEKHFGLVNGYYCC